MMLGSDHTSTEISVVPELDLSLLLSDDSMVLSLQICRPPDGHSAPNDAAAHRGIHCPMSRFDDDSLGIVALSAAIFWASFVFE